MRFHRLCVTLEKRARLACPAGVIFPWRYRLLLDVPEATFSPSPVLQAPLCVTQGETAWGVTARHAFEGTLVAPGQLRYPFGPEKVRFVITWHTGPEKVKPACKQTRNILE